ncbi:MAG: T9SS type A sorting domain-containing protein [Bacteroidetes bacterium]|nr:T9SS type A sorting domain-containing protein [Bacteroidota bacterium]
MPVAEIYEYNYQSLYNIYLSTMARRRNQFTDTDKTVIEAIAQQCPKYGGDAVYMARAMVFTYNDSMIYNDTAACFGNLRQLNSTTPKNQTTVEQPTQIYFYPVPAQDKITFRYMVNEGKVFQLTIYDTFGKIYFTKKYISNGEINEDIIDTKELPNGIYYYSTDTGKNGKISILK